MRPDPAAVFSEEYGIPVEALDPEVHSLWEQHQAHGSPPSPASMATAVGAFVEQLRTYPPDVLRAAGVERVVLVAGLHGHHRRSGGLASAETRTVYLDVEAEPSLVHHELSHMIDAVTETSILNHWWAKANPAGFTYGVEGIDVAEELWIETEYRRPGFCTPYAQIDVWEDRAEMFRMLAVRPLWVHAQAETDEAFAKKAVRLQRHLATFHRFFSLEEER